MKARLLLETQDVWFFRTSRPFGAVQVSSSGGEPQLLPPPAVVFGAVRTALGDRQGVNWSAYRAAWANWPASSAPAGWFGRLGPPVVPAGQTWPADSIRLAGCLPAKVEEGKEKTLFPLPGFVLVSKHRGERITGADLRCARPTPVPGRSSITGGLWPTLPDEEDFEGEAQALLLTEGDFHHLLKGNEPAVFRDALVQPSALADLEPRVGIARSLNTRTVLPGHLYSLEAHRWRSRVPFRDCATTYGLHALLENVRVEELKSPLALTLGGERRLAWGRAAAVEDWFTEPDLRAEVQQAIALKGGWWLSLATPAYFKTGWRPTWIEGDEAQGWQAVREGEQAGRLVGLVADAPLLQSGWDLAGRQPKPVRRLMPPGTTWFFELPENVGPGVLASLNGLQGKCIADENAHAGYGLAFVGAWNGRAKE